MSGKRRGAKSKFQDWITEEGLIKLEGWARKGLTDEQIAHNIGIQRTTLYAWKKKYPDIDNALKKGKEVIDIQVENAMLKRALGYEFEEIKTYIEDTGGKKKKRVEKTVKHIPPDTTAQIFWLRNRTQEWRNKDHIDAEKVLADTALVKARTKLLEGINEGEKSEIADALRGLLGELDS